MIERPEPWAGAAAIATPQIDHLGLVVADVAPAVGGLRSAGFSVSDPVPLAGAEGALGQTSAHCVFAGSYLEISAPDPGSANHLVPLLAAGPGWRLLVLRCTDAAAERRNQIAAGIPCGPLQQAARTIALPGGPARAEFVWFEMPGLIPGALVGFVEHRHPEHVFDPALTRHPNGATGIAAILLGDFGRMLATLAGAGTGYRPSAWVAPGRAEAVAGIAIEGTAQLAVEELSLRSAERIAP